MLPENVASISIWPGELPSTSVNFPYHRETFRQLLCNFHAVRRPSINIPSNCVNFRHLLSTFRAAEKPSVNIPQLLVRPGDLPSTLHPVGRLSFNYRLLSVRQGYLPLTFVNFLCCPKAFHELSVRPVDFRHLFSIFCVVGRPSMYFCQHSVWTGDLP